MDFKAWGKERAEHFERVAQYALPMETKQPWKLHQAMRYAVLDGGKRIRPLLVYAAGLLVDAKEGVTDHLALAVEYIHSYSLVHDDMPCMDNDTLRRGKLTTHRKFGEAMGMLTGDALQALAFQQVAQAKVKPEQVVQLVKLLAVAAGPSGMCGGQAIDLLAAHSQLDLPTLSMMHRMKTGAMIRASALMGIYAGHEMPEPALIGQVATYSDAIGLAFQVIDDILDVTADTQTLGKTAGKDAANEKPTYVSLLGIEKARELAQEQYNIAKSALQALEADERYAGKTQRLHEIADFIMARDH